MCRLRGDGYCSLEELARERCASAVLYHGSLGLSNEQFVARFVQVVLKYVPESVSEESRVAFGCELSATDLYLATACGLPTESAWKRFYFLYDCYLKQCLRRVCRESYILNELMDDPPAEFFLPDRSGRSRIASYEGLSSLHSWLRVVVANRVINERERRCNSLRCRELPKEEPSVPPMRVDQVLDADRFEPLLRDCLKEGCRSLSDRERQLMLSRYEEELPLGVIARRWGIHQSTVTRILERSFVKFRNASMRTLVERHKVPATELHALGSMVLDGEMSLPSLLACLKCEALLQDVEKCETCLLNLGVRSSVRPQPCSVHTDLQQRQLFANCA